MARPSCIISVSIGPHNVIGLIARRKASQKIEFYADHDRVSDTVDQLINFLHDHRGNRITSLGFDIHKQLTIKQAVQLIRACRRLYREVARHG